MKKLIRLGLVLGVLTAALTCSALAAGTVYGTGSVSYADGKCSVTYSEGVKDGQQYALLMVTNPGSINDESVMYIDQVAAKDGKVTFENFIPKVLPESEQQTWTVLLGGEFTGGGSPKTIGTLTYGEGVPLSGKVELQGRSDHSGATVTLTGDGGSRTATTVADGSFSIAGVAPGTYTLKITMPGYLSYTINSLEVVGSTSVEKKTLLAGDVNGSGEANIYDLTELLGEFNRVGDEIVNSANDLNGSNEINVYDLTLLLANFNCNDVEEI